MFRSGGVGALRRINNLLLSYTGSAGSASVSARLTDKRLNLMFGLVRPAEIWQIFTKTLKKRPPGASTGLDLSAPG